MCRLIGWVSSSPVTARQALGDAALTRLLHLSQVHRHGWGAAWQDGEHLRVRRSPIQASRDAQFSSLLSSLATSAAIIHLRLGTPGYGRQLVDNHPYTDGTYAFAHNGAVLPADRVGALLLPSTRRRPRGTTDSERIFLALRDELDTLPAIADPGSRVAEAIAVVIERARRSGLHASSWNSMLLGPDGLSVICHHDSSWVPKDVQLWPQAYPPQAVAWPPYFDLRMRDHPDAIHVVASSGIVDDVTEWTLLPNHSILQLATDGARLVRTPETVANDISPAVH